MILDSVPKFQGELTCSLENDRSNLEYFHQSTLMKSFYPKQKMCEIKSYREVMCHDKEEQCEIWRRIDLSFKD